MQNTTLITGAGGAIGNAIVQKLLERGDNVIEIDRKFETRTSLSSERLELDISKEQLVNEASSYIFGKYSKIHNLINCAGIIGNRDKMWNISSSHFENVVMNNVLSTFLMCKAVVPNMISNGYGRIINFGAIAGKDGSALSSHYAASKAAIITMTKALGKELAEFEDILCNSIVPAAVETPALMEHSKEDIASHLGKIPKGRFCQPHEVAELAIWLASSKCSFSTGAVYDISGGRATY
ncbi:SDR family NAD(P)-dependent oxidoreductase [Pseudoalteromonas piscicida]|uniref:SDR family NAD(P)-dependent oxidoreductase n=1 Tax=Pseudoalteromonas piscicida TaxID=43662 RepID=UPI003C7E33F3